MPLRPYTAAPDHPDAPIPDELARRIEQRVRLDDPTSGPARVSRAILSIWAEAAAWERERPGRARPLRGGSQAVPMVGAARRMADVPDAVAAALPKLNDTHRAMIGVLAQHTRRIKGARMMTDARLDPGHGEHRRYAAELFKLGLVENTKRPRGYVLSVLGRAVASALEGTRHSR